MQGGMICTSMVMLRQYQVTVPGFYIVVDDSGHGRPDSAYLMKFDPTDTEFPWRNETGCADWGMFGSRGKFGGNEWFTGPVEWSPHV